jgi:ubiquinone/menaquinone biosynthesis C-methylase UbiE
MNQTDPQSQDSVESFGWEWTERTVTDSTRTAYHRLFKNMGLWHDHHDGKVLADVCSGNGRHVWALSRLTKAKKIISVELSLPAAEYQRPKFADDPRIETIQGDAAQVVFAAHFIYLVGAIQHTAEPLKVLKRLYDNLNDRGEMLITFYMKTPATMTLEPLRQVLKRLPKEALWTLTIYLAPIFMARKPARAAGYRHARHNAYDWFGGHHYQRYFAASEIERMFDAIGIPAENVLRIGNGIYKVRKGSAPALDDKKHVFGADG